jgi:hypothetical protein
MKMCNIVGIIGLVAGSVLGNITSDFANPQVQMEIIVALSNAVNKDNESLSEILLC